MVLFRKLTKEDIPRILEYTCYTLRHFVVKDLEEYLSVYPEESKRVHEIISKLKEIASDIELLPKESQENTGKRKRKFKQDRVIEIMG